MAKERIMDLSAKTVLLTGASKGIGAAIAKVLCAQGAHVIAHYGGDRAGAEAATAGAADGRRLLAGADLADLAQVDRLWDEAVSWRGRVDAIVNNAAVMEMNGGVEND
jgi:NAD(P)-dependent dehydrogenase (short-subunit alcohol dehydrogenase family)